MEEGADECLELSFTESHIPECILMTLSLAPKAKISRYSTASRSGSTSMFTFDITLIIPRHQRTKQFIITASTMPLKKKIEHKKKSTVHA